MTVARNGVRTSQPKCFKRNFLSHLGIVLSSVSHQKLHLKLMLQQMNDLPFLSQQLQRNTSGHFLVRRSTTSRASAGLHRGGKAGRTSGSLGASFVRSTVRPSIAACPIPSSELPSPFYLMGMSLGGTGSSEWLAGTHISGYGK